MSVNPFSAGRWVSGEHFYGRTHLLETLLRSDESCHWVIGKRRMGKTSLLRQLEHLVNTREKERFALFWDIQGSYDSEGFFDSLYDAVEDNQDLYPQKWEGLDFELDEEGNSAALLKKLSRAISRAGMELFLLIDESEELLNIGKHDPALLSKLRRFFQTNRKTTTIMVSSPTLERLTAMAGNTSPFLHGFSVSYLGNFTEAETDQLLKRGIEREADRAEVFRLTDGNPFETQLLARHYWENQDLEKVLLELETNPTLNQTIEVNIDLLSEDERTVLKEIHCGTLPFQDFERAITVKLVRMGYLKDNGGGHAISSFFQGKWLAVHLLDGQETARRTRPGEVIEGIVLGENADEVLKQIVDIYKVFLELAQKGKRVTRTGDQFDLPQKNGAAVVDPKSLPLVEENRPGIAWLIAVIETVSLLQNYLPGDHTWSLHRLFQMVEGGASRYSEKDFLDLMMLIAEEAELE